MASQIAETAGEEKETSGESGVAPETETTTPPEVPAADVSDTSVDPESEETGGGGEDTETIPDDGTGGK